MSFEKTRPRRGSAKQRLIDYVMRQPAFTVELAAGAIGVSPTNLYRDLGALEDAGVLVKSAEYRGPTIYRSPEVLAAIDSFAERAGKRSYG